MFLAEPRPLPQCRRAGKGGRGLRAGLTHAEAWARWEGPGPALLATLPAPRPQGARPLPYLARSPAAGAARGPGAPGSGART